MKPGPAAVKCAVASAAAIFAVLVALAPAARAEDCTAVHEVAITYTFEPGDIYVAPGDCIHFTNIHGIEHSAVGLEREFNTGILMPGGTALIEFDEETVIPYVCGVHPLMSGVIIVKSPD